MNADVGTIDRTRNADISAFEIVGSSVGDSRLFRELLKPKPYVITIPADNIESSGDDSNAGPVQLVLKSHSTVAQVHTKFVDMGLIDEQLADQLDVELAVNRSQGSRIRRIGQKVSFK